jgi:LacI family transcriptional regulator, galactose operon repressor
VAILSVDAQRGRQLVEICSVERVRVPDEVAILAGDTDEILCEVCSPPLSSIEVGAHRIGHEAAAILHQMMEGALPPDAPLKIPPQWVLSRRSTDILAIEDAMVARAVRYIQNHAHQGIRVDDVLREVPISRRALELNFKRFVGRLPAEEIRRLRLAKAKELLAQSDMSIEDVAVACGYAGASPFGLAFRKSFGKTPLAFRRQLMID